VRLRLAHVLWLLGDDDGADRQRDLALDAAAASSHGYSRAVACVWAAILAIDRRDVAELRRQVQALDGLAGEDSPAQVTLATEMFAGYLDVMEGDASAGLARVRAARQQVIAGQAPAPGLPGVATRVLLECYAVAGQPRAGLALAGQALGLGRGAELWEAEVRRLRAGFLAAAGAPAGEVTAELDRALGVARRQQSRALEARIRETLAER
jgi:hypothetical protein